MLYHLLYPLHAYFSALNVFRYITFRAIGATLTAFLILLLCGNRFIKMMQENQIGQVVRDDGPASHFSKRGVPTMGGVLILFAVTVTTLLWVDLSNSFVWIILGVSSRSRASITSRCERKAAVILSFIQTSAGEILFSNSAKETPFSPSRSRRPSNPVSTQIFR